MVKIARQTDLDKIVQFVHEYNNNINYYSAYMPKPKDAIHQEMKTSIKKNQVLTMKENDQILGVLVFYISPKKTVDVAGPFVIHDNLAIAKVLLDQCIMMNNGRDLNFFFSDTSDFYKTLMTFYNADFNDYEFIMKCYLNTFQPYPQKVPLTKANKEEKDRIIAIHQSIFKQTYITDDMLADDNRYRYLYVYRDKGAITGLALMINKGNYTVIETFGLISKYRGKGLSKPFLSTLMHYAFKNHHAKYIMLVVDEINTIATKLYSALGFVIEYKNVSYTLVSNNENDMTKEG